MTDERFEHDLSATVERLMDLEAPADLRVRVASVVSAEPATASHTLRAGLWPAASLAAAVVLAVVGLALLRPMVSPVAPAGSPLASAAVSLAPSAPGVISASASATASVAAATAPPWAGQIGLPFVTVPADAVRSTVATDPASAASGGPLTGPFVYLANANQRAPAVVDVGGGSVRLARDTVVQTDERVVQTLSSEHWLVIEMVSAADPCAETSPMTWRIVAAPLEADGMPGAFTEVAKGAVKAEFQSAVVLGMNCSKEQPPPIALADDNLAWSVQTSASPDTGSTVSIQPLNSRDVAPSSFATQTYVTQLALSTEMIAWIEEENGLANGGKPAWQAFDAPLSNLLARQAVEVGETSGKDHTEPPWLVLDGSVLYANLDQYAAVQGTVVRVEAGERTVVDPGRPNQNCGASAAEAGVLFLSCQGGSDTTSFGFNAVWTAATGLRAIAVDQVITESLPSVVRPGWLVLTDIVDTGGQSFTAIPLSALASPGPSPAPTPSPTPTPAPSDSLPPDASASPSSAVDLGMPIVSVPGWAPTSVEVQVVPDPKAAGPIIGPFRYEENATEAATLDVLDVRGGSRRTISLPLHAGEAFLQTAASSSWLVIAAAAWDGNCPNEAGGAHVAWRIIATPLGADGLPTRAFRQLAAGATLEQDRQPGIRACAIFMAGIDLHGDRLAYAVPADAAAAGSGIVVLDLRADGHDQTVSQFASRRQLVALSVSPDAVAWVESGIGLADGTFDWAVMEVRIGDATPSQVDVADSAALNHSHPDDVTLDGTALLVSLDDSPSTNLGVVLADGGTATIVVPPAFHGDHCAGLGVSGTHVVLLCWSKTDEWIAVWSKDGGLQAIGVDGAAVPVDEVWILGDRLVWTKDSRYESESLSALDSIP